MLGALVTAVVLGAMADWFFPQADTLVQVLHARLDPGAVPRIGLRGTAQLQGERVPLAWQLLRRPIGAARQFLDW